MKSVEHRKGIYALIEKWLGRELTKEEHEEVKVLLTTMNHDAVKDAVASVERMKAKLKPMGKALWNALHKKGVDAEELAKLRDALNMTDAELSTEKHD